jgi:hypothetical protein
VKHLEEKMKSKEREFHEVVGSGGISSCWDPGLSRKRERE